MHHKFTRLFIFSVNSRAVTFYTLKQQIRIMLEYFVQRYEKIAKEKLRTDVLDTQLKFRFAQNGQQLGGESPLHAWQ